MYSVNHLLIEFLKRILPRVVIEHFQPPIRQLFPKNSAASTSGILSRPSPCLDDFCILSADLS